MIKIMEEVKVNSGDQPATIPSAVVANPPASKTKDKKEESDFPFAVAVADVYEGPLDLLLDLIRKQDIEIYDIPIAKITAQYLAYVEKMRELEVEEFARQQGLLGKKPPAPAAEEPKITIDDFLKIDMRVGVIKEAASVKGSDKLLHLHVDIGEPKPRSIVAGIAGAYQPETLIGRKVAIVVNLQPRKLKGLESQGMIIAASLEDTSPALVSFLEDVPIGARLK